MRRRTVVPGTPIAKLEAAGRLTLSDVVGLLAELRTFSTAAAPSDANRDRLLAVLDAALDGPPSCERRL